MNAGALNRVGAGLAEVHFDQCQLAAKAALAAHDPEHARLAARAALTPRRQH
jgi:phosphotransferase system enzyme I (PtsI)